MIGNRLTVAIVGGFQRGKSTLVNAFLGCDVAEMGRGLSTTHENNVFPLTSSVAIIDTPGFDANGKDDGTAEKAIREADAVIYVHESKTLGETCADVFRLAVLHGKRILFLLNCMNDQNWSPSENDDIIRTIAAELSMKKELSMKSLKRTMIPIGGDIVVPVNVLWARFGLGLVSGVTDAGQKTVRKIRRYAEDALGLAVEEMSEDEFRSEMFRRSGFQPVDAFVKNLPFELLKEAVADPGTAIDRIVDRFAAELKKRWFAA